MNKSIQKSLTGLFIACILAMLWSYQSGYDNAIEWQVTTTGEIIEFPAWILESELMTHEIKGEKYLLSEQYTGGEIIRNINQDKAFLAIIWIGLCITLVAATYMKRYAFFIMVGLFAIFLNRLNLFEVGLFGIHAKMIVFLPALALIIPLVVFNEYKKNTPLIVRIATLIIISSALLLGVDDGILFTDHIIAHSLYGLTLCSLLFLFIISEEIVFSILYVVTSGRGGKSNHTHFLILSLIYLGNLVLYYLNKSGLFENSFFLFDPFILLTISSVVILWSIKFKESFLSKHVDQQTIYLLAVGLGIVMQAFMSHHMVRGNDGVYQAFHYFILYFHIGFGVLFFLYIIGNFIDPLIKGMEIYKIVYKERNFPYLSARLGGFFAILAFYFLAGQEPFNLLKAGYYNYLSQEAKTEGNALLAKEYILQAGHLGYNTHYPNYSMGWAEMKKEAEYPAKTYFFNAGQRYPSPYALINYGNIDSEINPNKVQAIYEESLRKKSSGEIENNLGLLHLQKGEMERAISYFENAKPSNSWNDAPSVNKWNALKKLELIDSIALVYDYRNGNYGVKSNILTTQSSEAELSFEFEGLEEAGYLHRQVYLLNSSYLFGHDSIESLMRREIEQSSDGAFNDRMRRALAIHLYNKGEVNEAFMMFDYLQANTHQYYKGEYLDALGKLAMDQEAYQLSLDFFGSALELKYTASLFSRLEVLARMGKADEISDELLKALRKNPELTTVANAFLEKLDGYEPREPRERVVPVLTDMADSLLISLGRTNAFNEAQVVAVVDELKKREASGGYEILVDAVEINPNSPELLQKYAMVALDWNLVEYADQTLEKLQELLRDDEFQSFKSKYDSYKQELEDAAW